MPSRSADDEVVLHIAGSVLGEGIDQRAVVRERVRHLDEATRRLRQGRHQRRPHAGAGSDLALQPVEQLRHVGRTAAASGPPSVGARAR
ncbi:MAG: hypothetical protein R2713_17560 [Ilumatobacteraceae bacterium]